jgi:hypothetical protein
MGCSASVLPDEYALCEALANGSALLSRTDVSDAHVSEC